MNVRKEGVGRLTTSWRLVRPLKSKAFFVREGEKEEYLRPLDGKFLPLILRSRDIISVPLGNELPRSKS